MHYMGVHLVSAIIGAVLLKGSIAVWLARIWPWYRKKVEYIFLDGKNLYQQNAPYSGTVTFFKWWAFVPGALLVLPRFVIIDIILMLVVVVLWRYFVNRARLSFAQAQ